MFRQGNIAVRFNTILPRQHETKDGKEIGLLECQCEINPFSAKLATDLDDFVRSTLYTRTDAEVVSKLGAATFRLTMPPQEIAVKAAPDQGEESDLAARVHDSVQPINRASARAGDGVPHKVSIPHLW